MFKVTGQCITLLINLLYTTSLVIKKSQIICCKIMDVYRAAASLRQQLVALDHSDKNLQILGKFIYLNLHELSLIHIYYHRHRQNCIQRKKNIGQQASSLYNPSPCT